MLVSDLREFLEWLLVGKSRNGPGDFLLGGMSGSIGQATYAALAACSIRHTGNGVEPMADKAAACVREVVAIATGEGTVEERRKAAEQRIAGLLTREAEKTLSHHSIAQDLRDRFGAALNAEHDPDAREVLDKALDFLGAKIGLG